MLTARCALGLKMKEYASSSKGKPSNDVDGI